MTLEEFFKKNPKFRRLSSIPRLDELFYFLTKNHTAFKMEEITKKRRPALAAVARTLEKDFHDRKAGKNGMNFSGNDQNILLKMFIGSVISGVMRELGYVKAMNKNLNSGESEFFSAGTLYVKCESLQEQKERADRFWMAYNVGEKVVEILENWPQISADKFNPHTVQIQRRLKYKAFDIWPLSAVIERYYNSKIFVSTLQLIIELERLHPGITALSELKLVHPCWNVFDEEYSFSLMIMNNLPDYVLQNGINLDSASIAFNYERYMGLELETQQLEDRMPESRLWRVTRPANDGISTMKKALEPLRDEWWSNMFDEFGLMDRVREVLKADAARAGDKSTIPYMSLYHLSGVIGKFEATLGHVSLVNLFKELARRIWCGEAPDIDIGFISGRHVDHMTAYKSFRMPGPEKYIPIFKYNCK
ncbi:MAG TPA: hypothetical protein PK467_06390 [Candidatus Wallbacteria bacterium]|nr:hypothetical protein [Candidatus Wallbacteria bacterium]